MWQTALPDFSYTTSFQSSPTADYGEAVYDTRRAAERVAPVLKLGDIRKLRIYNRKHGPALTGLWNPGASLLSPVHLGFIWSKIKGRELCYVSWLCGDGGNDNDR